MHSLRAFTPTSTGPNPWRQAEAAATRRLAENEWEDVPFQERLIQNVMLLNRKEINDHVLSAQSGPVARALALKEPAKAVAELYLVALNRQPTDKEVAHIKTLLEKAQEKNLTSFWQDLFWALLNSSEFILNH